MHWPYPAEAVQALLPEGLEIDLFDGSAWVGLVPFVLVVGGVPGFGGFPETNVRTYVRGPDRDTGVWFFSLDAARLAAVVGARLSFGLPYFWSRMRARRENGAIAYESRRRVGAAAWLRAEVEPGESIVATNFDDYLTARFRLFSVFRGGLASAWVEHVPWPLRTARVLKLEQNLVQAAGLPVAEGQPIVHYSEGVEVRVGTVERISGSVYRTDAAR